MPEVRALVPRSFNRYVEPFLGGAATFFALRPKQALLSDANAELIETYEAIKQDWQDVWCRLEWHQEQHSHEHYYSQRAKAEVALPARAARFIYLNRACWNGLYRVNLRGQFNVPKGSKDRIVFDFDDFGKVASALKYADLRHGDFEKSIENCGEGDLLFIDPPYTVKHNMNGFVKYNENLFSWSDQIRLRNAVRDAAARGAHVIVTNADHASIRNLYKGIANLKTVRRSSVLSGDKRYRGHVTELVLILPKRSRASRAVGFGGKISKACAQTTR